MATHPRRGARAAVAALDPELLRVILRSVVAPDLHAATVEV
jgi:hypothetical protein